MTYKGNKPEEGEFLKSFDEWDLYYRHTDKYGQSHYKIILTKGEAKKGNYWLNWNHTRGKAREERNWILFSERHPTLYKKVRVLLKNREFYVNTHLVENSTNGGVIFIS